jgi:hypothetical protein
MKQRIALVAVSALTAGLFSVVSTPVAQGAVLAAEETMGVATTNSVTGVAFVGAAGIAIETNTNLGVISLASTDAAPIAAVSANIQFTAAKPLGAGNILPTGTVAVTISSASKTGVTVSGGRIVTTPTITTGATLNVASDGSNATTVAAGSMNLLISPNGAAGSTMTIQGFTGATITSTTPTNGTLRGSVTFTVVSAGVSGVYSAGDSTVATQAAVAKGAECATTNAAFDDASSVRNGRVGCILVVTKDAYGSVLTSGTITASATNNAKVLVGVANAAAGFLTAAPFSSVGVNAASLYVAVTQATANTGGSTVVTITWNGVVIGTKTITFQGDIAKLTLLTTGATASNTVYANGATNAAPAGAVGKIFYSATDAAGTPVTLAAAPTISDATGAMTPGVLSAGADAAAQTLQIAANGFGFATMTIVANPLVGAGTYRLKVTNAAGADIKTDVINATVSGGTASFTASWDKASYSPGESAILTISAKDSGGRPVAQGTLMTGGVLTVNTAGLTSQTCPADISTSTFNKADGSRVCTFAVGNTAGAYSFSMALTNSSGQSATTGSVKIATAGVTSNEDVLKAIVSLIASINKQIALLQKALLKK